MATERDVKATVTVAKEGDVGAFKEVASDIENLDQSAGQLGSGGLGAVGEQLSSIDGALKTSGASIRSFDIELAHSQALLEDAARSGAKTGSILEELGSKAKIGGVSISSLTAKLSLYTAALAAGWEAGKKLQETLDSFSGGAHTAFAVADMQNLIDKFTGADTAAREAAQGANTLRNELNILKNSGIDPAGLSAEQLSAKVAELGKKGQEAAVSYGKFSESLGVSKVKLDEAATSLSTFLTGFAAANQQLSKEDLGKLFKAQIQEVLDAYALLKQGPPKAIADLAASWGVLTSAGDDAVKKNKAQVDAIREQMGLAATQTKEQLTALAQNLVTALEGIEIKELKFIDPEKFEGIKQGVADIVEKFRDAGSQIPIEVAEIATSVGLMISGFEIGPPAAAALAASLAPVAAAADTTSAALTATGAAAEAASGGVVTLVTDGETGRHTLLQLGEAAETAAAGLVTIESDAQSGIPVITNLGDVAETAAAGMVRIETDAKTGAVAITNLGAAAEGAATDANTLNEALTPETEAKPFAWALEGVNALYPGLESLAAKAPEAAAGLQSIAAVDMSKLGASFKASEAAVDGFIAKVKAAQAAVATLAAATIADNTPTRPVDTEQPADSGGKFPTDPWGNN